MLTKLAWEARQELCVDLSECGDETEGTRLVTDWHGKASPGHRETSTEDCEVDLCLQALAKASAIHNIQAY